MRRRAAAEGEQHNTAAVAPALDDTAGPAGEEEATRAWPVLTDTSGRAHLGDLRLQREPQEARGLPGPDCGATQAAVCAHSPPLRD